MIIKSDLESCRARLQSMIGSPVRLSSNGGRKRIIVHEGVVDNCYPNVFTVRCQRESDGAFEIVSYSYIDVLTRAVRIAIPEQADTAAVV
ncbi:MAG: Veg family protein [Saccharofermentans sp.]|nr:Veg family protein [Clostridiales bacterium]MBR4493234.1 Veg family protein [Clostridiales bacterium]MCR5048255.1 Veg family protein [Saccharofermentans sp.]